MSMEQINVGKLLSAINRAEDIMFLILNEEERKDKLMSRIIYAYLDEDLCNINKELLKKYGYDDVNYDFFMLNQNEIRYDTKVVYKIDTSERIEDILSDFYSNKNRIIKDCDDVISKTLYFSNKYNKFIDELADIMNNDNSLKLSKQFKTTMNRHYDNTIPLDSQKVIYNYICKKNVINYGYIRINIKCDVFKYKKTPVEYWDMFKKRILEKLAEDLLSCANIFNIKTTLVEQKFIINSCSNNKKFRVYNLFKEYRYTCATTKKFIKNNEEAFNSKFATVPEFK